MYLLESLNKASLDQPPPVVIRGGQLDFRADLSKMRPLAEGDDGFDASSPSCSYFSISSKAGSPIFSVEVTLTIMIFFLLFLPFFHSNDCRDTLKTKKEIVILFLCCNYFFFDHVNY